MSELVIAGVSKQFASSGGKQRTTVLSGIDITVRSGEMTALLGPSGCGKSTTLRCIAGLESPDAGTITLGGETLFDQSRKLDLVAHKRNIGLVFQSFALWPHLTAYENIEFPLKSRRVRAEARRRAVAEIAAIVELDDVLLARRPGQLSGGQQQRVALARALVARPKVVLFDEPLSSLDSTLREQLRSELHLLHSRIGFTGVYVTHDLEEALALGDTIAVMHEGRVVQRDTGTQLIQDPDHLAVARLLGARLLARIDTARYREGQSVLTHPALAAAGAPAELEVHIRPRSLRVGAAQAGMLVVPEAEVLSKTVVGDREDLMVELAGIRLTVSQPLGTGRVEAGDRISLIAPPDEAYFFAPDGSRWRPAE